jgi:hypothetical protein
MNSEDKIYKDDAFKHGIEVLNVFNELNNGNLFLEKDLYADGELLFISVYDNEESRKILSSVIFDMELYIKKSSEIYALNPNQKEIILCSLAQAQKKHCGYDDRIMYDKDSEEFIIACMLEEEDDEH